jgi:hypothetical protein
MKYFERCLSKISDSDEIDISIHCDATVFEWLLEYVLAKEEYEKQHKGRVVAKIEWSKPFEKAENGGKAGIQFHNGPRLHYKNATTILISADFLKIDALVKECLSFFAENIEEVGKVLVDTGCLNSNIIRQMAREIPLDRLSALQERKDKLVSRLYMKKLEILLEKERTYLHKCAFCNHLFILEHRAVLHCSKAKSVIDHNGELRSLHVIDRTWELKKFVTFIRETYRISWREIYWKIWGYLHVLKCGRCNEYYNLAELGNCFKHPEKPKVKLISNTPLGSSYSFRCCDKEVSVAEMLDLSN